MCYSMYGKRSGAMKQEVGDKSATADQAAPANEAATARRPADEKAHSSYSGFVGRLQSWMAKGDKKREESVS